MKKANLKKFFFFFFNFNSLGIVPFSKKNLLIDFTQLIQQDKLINFKKFSKVSK